MKLKCFEVGIADQGERITLSFRAKPGGPVLATASESIPSCVGVGVHWPNWYIEV